MRRNHQAVFSGSGGQGLMFIGKLIAKLALDEYPHITFFPSYGAEVRGGTSNCQVILSDAPIASPIVEMATLQVLMNQPSVDRFLPGLSETGLAFVNSSLAEAQGDNVVSLPASRIALEAGNARAANVVVLGAVIRRTELIAKAKVLEGLDDMASGKGQQILELNRAAFERGWDLPC